MDKGIQCPRCGCRDLHVANTIMQLGRVIRYRQCRHCGKRIRTKESPEIYYSPIQITKPEPVIQPKQTTENPTEETRKKRKRRKN